MISYFIIPYIVLMILYAIYAVRMQNIFEHISKCKNTCNTNSDWKKTLIVVSFSVGFPICLIIAWHNNKLYISNEEIIIKTINETLSSWDLIPMHMNKGFNGYDIYGYYGNEEKK